MNTPSPRTNAERILPHRERMLNEYPLTTNEYRTNTPGPRTNTYRIVVPSRMNERIRIRMLANESEANSKGDANECQLNESESEY